MSGAFIRFFNTILLSIMIGLLTSYCSSMIVTYSSHTNEFNLLILCSSCLSLIFGVLALVFRTQFDTKIFAKVAHEESRQLTTNDTNPNLYDVDIAENELLTKNTKFKILFITFVITMLTTFGVAVYFEMAGNALKRKNQQAMILNTANTLLRIETDIKQQSLNNQGVLLQHINQLATHQVLSFNELTQQVNKLSLEVGKLKSVTCDTTKLEE